MGNLKIMDMLFRPMLRAFQSNIHENHSAMLFPQKHKRKYHHVVGHRHLFSKEIFPILPGFARNTRHSMVTAFFSKQNFLYLRGLRIKK
ncbi:hypothetical protein [Pelosinus sp. sgz500959]|uniref:hypothetical protein n=1 Tax=Pelosinus sp. sgz500959 TaxID=3242472 RepID=UPI00367250D6